MTDISDSGLPLVQRVVTGHDAGDRACCKSKDFSPTRLIPMHRTNLIDYGIVLKGEIELELEDGRRKVIQEAGVVIQRGTNHLWHNRTDRPCRIAFILIEAPAYLHDGVSLTEAKPEQVDPRYGESRGA